MNIESLMQVLQQADDTTNSVAITLPNGTRLPAHFHLTEIGKVTKDFVDCGGIRRQKSTCVLQTWVADDLDHRLSFQKFQAILLKYNDLSLAVDTEIELEVQENTLSMYQLLGASIQDGTLNLELASTKTECLAPERCGVPGLEVLGDSCSGSGCC